MTSKGPSPVDLDSAEPTSRRRLFGAFGAVARPAVAAPNAPTRDDRALLRQVMDLELAARDLYRATAAAAINDDVTAVATVFAANHAAYGDAIAAISGFSANSRNDDLFDDLESAFTGDAAAFVDAAISLENTAVATHSDVIASYESVRARTITASVIMVEARMATVLAELGGVADDLDELFEPSADALSITGGAS